jgi:hypothetical protein
MSENKPPYIAHDSIVDANIICETCGNAELELCKVLFKLSGWRG